MAKNKTLFEDFHARAGKASLVLFSHVRWVGVFSITDSEALIFLVTFFIKEKSDNQEKSTKLPTKKLTEIPAFAGMTLRWSVEG